MKRAFYFVCLFTWFCLDAWAGYNMYNIKDIFSISVSSNMEIRKSEDSYTKILQDTLCYLTNAEVVFQQKDLSNLGKSAFKKYCRIMILTDDNGNGEYPCSDESDFSYNDMEELKSLAKQELAPGFDFILAPIASIETSSYGYKYINVYYERSGLNGPVCVNMCFFFNYNFAVKMVLSYRKSESNIWAKDIQHTINSFNWKNPFTITSYTEQTFEDHRINNSKSFASVFFVGCLAIIIVCLIIITLAKYNANKRSEELEANVEKASELKSTKSVNSALSNLASMKENISSKDTTLSQSDSDTIASVKEKAIKPLINNHPNHLDSSLTEKEIERPKLIGNDAEAPQQHIYKKGEANFQVIDSEIEVGNIPKQDIIHVNYSSPTNQFSRDGYYIDSYFPKKGNIVFPYRRSKAERRGYTEEMFECELRSSLDSFTNYEVLGDVSILPNDGCHPYEPDVAILEKNAIRGIRIDIEIDEPYSGYDKKPIHYIGCGDEFRDRNLVNMGWIVIRFSEKQIFRETDNCISFIKHIISLIDSSAPLTGYAAPSLDKHWSLVEAQMMIVRKYRENMLNHNFSKFDTATITKQAITQTEIEKQAASQVDPLVFNANNYNNIDGSSTRFSQDGLLSFEPNEHVYVYDGSIELTPVSKLLSDFFEPFDSIAMSERYAMKYGYDQCKVMEEWDSNGKEAREIGTFLHTQIEAYLNGNPISDKIRYTYKGEFIKEDKIVSISTELEYFKSFLDNNPICPFRTEWHIFDLEYQIAGTIDLLCRKGITFDIYDWKRSRKASPDEKVWRFGINGMSHIPDISFYHYALQQNIYKYILETNYGIFVSNMYIVVLHPELGSYKKYQIPDMKNEVKTILQYIKSNH